MASTTDAAPAGRSPQSEVEGTNPLDVSGSTASPPAYGAISTSRGRSTRKDPKDQRPAWLGTGQASHTKGKMFRSLSLSGAAVPPSWTSDGDTDRNKELVRPASTTIGGTGWRPGLRLDLTPSASPPIPITSTGSTAARASESPSDGAHKTAMPSYPKAPCRMGRTVTLISAPLSLTPWSRSRSR